MIKQILYISAIWAVFIFIGYHVLTAEVEAVEKDDKKVCEEYNGEWKKIGKGDEGGNKGCQFDNEKDQQIYSIRPGFSKDGTSEDSEYGREDLGEDAVTDIEHEICHGEDADTTKIDMCKSDEREENEMYKDYCDDVGGKWTKAGCETDHDGPKADKFEEKVTEFHQESEPKVKMEDWRNEVEIAPEDRPYEKGVNEKIGSPAVIQLEEGDGEKEAQEKVDDYNKEMDEYFHGDEEEDESEDEEPEQEEEENDESESESEE